MPRKLKMKPRAQKKRRERTDVRAWFEDSDEDDDYIYRPDPIMVDRIMQVHKKSAKRTPSLTDVGDFADSDIVDAITDIDTEISKVKTLQTKYAGKPMNTYEASIFKHGNQGAYEQLQKLEYNKSQLEEELTYMSENAKLMSKPTTGPHAASSSSSSSSSSPSAPVATAGAAAASIIRPVMSMGASYKDIEFKTDKALDEYITANKGNKYMAIITDDAGKRLVACEVERGEKKEAKTDSPKLTEFIDKYNLKVVSTTIVGLIGVAWDSIGKSVNAIASLEVKTSEDDKLGKRKYKLIIIVVQ